MTEAGTGQKQALTPQERAALDARDRRLLAGLLAKDDAVTAEALEIIRECVLAQVKRHSAWLLKGQRWNECLGEVRALCLRWRHEGLLRADEGLWKLSRRLLKQVADQAKTDLCYQKLSRSLNDDQLDDGAIDRLEAAATNAIFAYRRFADPEQQAAIREQGQWIAGAYERLSADDCATLDAVVAVWQGDAETVGEALGIAVAAGRQRLCRTKCALAKLAVAEGHREMAIRLKGKKHVEVLEATFAEEPGADHRLEELELLREGLLEGAARVELEAHLAGCPKCRRTLRTLDGIDDAIDSFLIVPPPPLPVDGGGLKSPRWLLAVALAVAALVTAAAFWLLREPPPPRPSPSVPQAVPKRPRRPFYSAPGKERTDGGTDGGLK